MKQDCEKYDECRKAVPLCNGRCPEYRKRVNNYKKLKGVSKNGKSVSGI